jgi:uncharacterized protein DUF4917
VAVPEWEEYPRVNTSSGCCGIEVEQTTEFPTFSKSNPKKVGTPSRLSELRACHPPLFGINVRPPVHWVNSRSNTCCNTQIALIDQIKAALDRNDFPLFVAEDTYKAKMERIMHSAYLAKSKSRFEKIGNDLFVFGFAFGESDDHILFFS